MREDSVILQNELGNLVHMSAELNAEGSVNLHIQGPDSTGHWEITVMEAEALKDLLETILVEI